MRGYARARDFFTEYFGGQANDGYHNPKTGFRSYFIRFENGAQIELMNKRGSLTAGRTANTSGIRTLHSASAAEKPLTG